MKGHDCHKKLYEELQGSLDFNFKEAFDRFAYLRSSQCSTYGRRCARQEPFLTSVERRDLLPAFHQGNDHFGLLNTLPVDNSVYENFLVFQSETLAMKAEVVRVTNEAKKTRKTGKKPENGLDFLVTGPPQGVL